MKNIDKNKIKNQFTEVFNSFKNQKPFIECVKVPNKK